MIIQLEIQIMINELKKHDSDKARDYINVLNRTLLDMRDQHKALGESMQLTSDSELEGLKLIQENRELRAEIECKNNVINIIEEK